VPETYNTIEELEEAIEPYWTTTWPGSGGCADRVLYSTATSITCPSGDQYLYEPIYEARSRDQSRRSGKRSGYPPFRMTPYFVSHSIIRNHLLKRLNATNGHYRYFQYGSVPKIGSTCTPTVSSVECTGPITARWNEVSHQHPYTSYSVMELDMTEVDDAILAVQNEVSTEALTSLDVLTNVAEFREIPSLLRSVAEDLTMILRLMRGRFSLRDLRSASRVAPRDLLKHPYRAMRKIGDTWMRHRYGIMPLVYTYRDLMKTMDRGISVKTKRSRVIQARPTGVSLPSSTVNYKWTDYDGYIRVTGNVFQNYSFQAAARAAGMGFNPLVTAWELIPYSFVADWFCNIGDYIARRTTPSLARNNYACISRRSSYTKRTWAHFANSDKTITFTKRTPTNWWGSQPPNPPSELIQRPEESQLLTEETTDAYQRWLFLLNDAQLNYSPRLNWRRMVDSAVMTLNRLGALNRHLKG
jgi:hypothetical protein